MMKKLFSVFYLLLCMAGYAQEKMGLTLVTPIGSKTISLEELQALKTHSLDSQVIYNHAGEYRSTLKNIKGTVLRDILREIPLGEESPKVLSEYYIVCIAEDGYKVVFSWNELFNSPTGDSVLVVLNIKEASNGRQEDRLALLSPHDYATGRRYVKQLETIIFLRIDK